MKGILLTILSVAVSSVAFAYAGGLDYFSARPDGDAISLEWKSGGETGLKSYTIERSASTENNFQAVGSVAATGNNSYYKYRDERVNGAPLAGAANNNFTPAADLYRYRLRMNYGSEVSYSQTVTVTKPSSGVRRTWGMIKEMFH